MGALDDLIGSQPAMVPLDDDWHRKIEKARTCGIRWPDIADAIAADTDTEPMVATTLRGRHERWLRRQG